MLASPADPNASAATYTHDVNNRLTGYSNTGQGITASYLYGPSEQRLKKTVNSTTTWYLYDGSQLIAEFNSTGSLQKRYDYLPGHYAPVQMMDSNGTYQVHSDHLGTPFMLTNSSKAVVWSAKKQAFGNTTVDEDPDANSSNISMNLRFPGQYYDLESGLHDNWHRTYNTDTGRYIQRDPIGLDGGVNVFAYVEGNPVGGVDAEGLFTYNAPPPTTLPLTPALAAKVTKLEECIKVPLVVTGGREQGSHKPTSAHPAGAAVDFSDKRNPSLSGMTKEFYCCAKKSGFEFAWHEPNSWTPKAKSHFHLESPIYTQVGNELKDLKCPCEKQ